MRSRTVYEEFVRNVPLSEQGVGASGHRQIRRLQSTSAVVPDRFRHAVTSSRQPTANAALAHSKFKQNSLKGSAQVLSRKPYRKSAYVFPIFLNFSFFFFRYSEARHLPQEGPEIRRALLPRVTSAFRS